MRTSQAGLALIRRHQPADGETQYMSQWSETWHRYSLVGGHVEPSESFRDCTIREIAEETLSGTR